MLKVDLHTHTQRSDSSNSAERTIQLAIEKGINVLSFVDHDTIPDVKQESALEKSYSIQIISGIECEWVDYQTGQAAHILGYNIKDYSYLRRLCETVLEQREENTRKQIKIIQNLGYNITEEEVRAVTKEPCIYTQNILQVLFLKGMITELFGEFNKKMFKKGGLAYQTIEYHRPEILVSAIVKGGGDAVLAHPGQQKNYYLMEKLVKSGLGGIELVHPSNTLKDQELIQYYSKTYQLFTTGGSDCHGILSMNGGAIGDYYIETQQIENIFLNY